MALTRPSRIPARACAALALGALAACTVGPNFHRPGIASPEAFGPEPQDVGSRTVPEAVDETWWASFHDPELPSLAQRYARQNLDLAAAAERIAQAQAQRRIAAAQGLPQLSANASYMHERQSENGTFSLVEPAPGAPLNYDLYQDGLQASWELDLFGRVRRAVEAAGAQTQAAVEARHALALAGLAELSDDYMQLRGAQALEAVVREDTAAAQSRSRLVRQRLTNGVATVSDVAQADAQASTIAENLPALRQAEAGLINAIALLLGQAPRSLGPELAPAAGQPLVPPRVPVGLPSELLRRRPDIREAEARLHAATAQTGVAVASFYPDVTLTGQIGTQALNTEALFDLSSRMAMVGPSIDLPIFEGGRLRGMLHLRQAQQREAAIAWRRTVLQAWRDVDDALTAYAEAQHRQGAVAEAARDDETALTVAQQRYAQGVESFIDVIAAQGALFEARESLARSQTEVESDLVALYKALGGGWRLADQVAATPPP
jgi:NodT family efflux transporter outer membrane factor (OMF) lipoprotein